MPVMNITLNWVPMLLLQQEKQSAGGNEEVVGDEVDEGAAEDGPADQVRGPES